MQSSYLLACAVGLSGKGVKLIIRSVTKWLADVQEGPVVPNSAFQQRVSISSRAGN